MKFRTKLLLSYFLLALVPLGMYTGYSYNTVSATVQEQMQYSANQVLEQTADLLAYKLENISYVADHLCLDSTLGNILKQDEGKGITPETVGDFNTAKEYVGRAYKENDMDKLMVYVSPGIFYAYAEPSVASRPHTAFSNLDYIRQTDWYGQLLENPTKLLWFPPMINEQSPELTESVISGFRFIKDADDYTQNLAVLRIDLLESRMNEIISKANTTKNGGAFLRNQNGDILAASNEEFFANRELADAAVARPEVWVTHKLGEETFSFGAIQIKGSDWQLVSVIPYSEIRAASNAIRMQMVFIMAVIALCAWIAAYLVADSITRRINLLTKHIKKVQEGDFSVIVNMKGSDEISELAHNYNYMLEQLERYARLQFQSGADLKAAELKALQAQINPHFLYNTLELINWMALTKNAPEISEIVQALAKFYKLSLSRGRDEIPIRDELAHIETYVQLQNYRYENRIRLNLEVDPSLYEYRILKLILQPVVENAILHGILESEQCQGTITVCGAMAGGGIMLTVEDDGIGMTPQQIAVMLGEAPAPIKRPGHGYGISNVIKRIHLYYGEKYGIRCESEPGSGSRVIISIAAIQEGIQEPGPR